MYIHTHKEGVRRLYNTVTYIHIQKCSVFPFYSVKYTNLLSPTKQKKSIPDKPARHWTTPENMVPKQMGTVSKQDLSSFPRLQMGQFRMCKKGNKEENCLCWLMNWMETKPPCVMLKRCQKSSTHGAVCFSTEVVSYDKCMVDVWCATTSRKLT